ncbi:MAG: PEGA domain-containing protein [Bryobacteraceae bacterium]|jgi:hypothetical protein
MTLTTGTRAAGSHIGKSILRKLLFVCAALVVTLPASAAVRGVRGGFVVGPAFGPWDYWYGPYFYGAYPVVSHPNAGLVKLDTKVKDAEVFVDGAFAGTAGDLKSMWLRQGAYNLEVRSPGRATYAERIYVVNGKTLRVRPELRVEPKS